jgi:hypothetical protein
LNNLYAACIACNRSKGMRGTRVVRGRYGYRAAPYSTARREALRARNTLLGVVLGYLVGQYWDASSSWTWFLVLACAWLAYRIEPDPQRDESGVSRPRTASARRAVRAAKAIAGRPGDAVP